MSSFNYVLFPRVAIFIINTIINLWNLTTMSTRTSGCLTIFAKPNLKSILVGMPGIRTGDHNLVPRVLPFQQRLDDDPALERGPWERGWQPRLDLQSNQVRLPLSYKFSCPGVYRFLRFYLHMQSQVFGFQHILLQLTK